AYVDRAKRDGATIKYVFETHFHADFVSGHLDLAQKTGAKIVFGPTANPGYSIYHAEDGEEFTLGNVRFRLIHTPGHTMESSCLLLIDETGKATALFTGDTLFIGDVGRPDLAQHVNQYLSEEKLAGHLYESLHHKIMPLADDIIVYPGHGAGSACGKKMSTETTDTLGHQKKVNYALNPSLTKEQFTKEILTGLVTPPAYFPKNVVMNIQGSESLSRVMQRGKQALSPEAFEAAANETDALVLDVRDASVFARGFIPGSINIGLEGQFASWVGTLIPDLKQPILLVAEPGREEEAITRLARVGYDYCIGYLEGGFAAWKASQKEVDTIESISAGEFAQRFDQNPTLSVLDMRRKSEYDAEHLVGAVNMPLDFLNDHLALIKQDQTNYVHCGAGYRSMVAISILKARGFENLVDIAGGIAAMKALGSLPLTDYVSPIRYL
ncbi:MAG: MBL fold metallo-hydrolase, partial [Bacteroidetes bacterium]|nr:MBL fold metallo-hydrolase [Bacteroidota bacterium]